MDWATTDVTKLKDFIKKLNVRVDKGVKKEPGMVKYKQIKRHQLYQEKEEEELQKKI